MILLYIFTINTSFCFLRVSGKKEALPRFIMENDVMPPIFGSYNYDPIKQVFEIEPLKNETVQHDEHNIHFDKLVNHTQFSTKARQFIRNRPLLTHSRFFRKHVGVTKPTNVTVSSARSKLISWWTIPKSLRFKNATKSS